MFRRPITVQDIQWTGVTNPPLFSRSFQIYFYGPFAGPVWVLSSPMQCTGAQVHQCSQFMAGHWPIHSLIGRGVRGPVVTLVQVTVFILESTCECSWARCIFMQKKQHRSIALGFMQRNQICSIALGFQCIFDTLSYTPYSKTILVKLSYSSLCWLNINRLGISPGCIRVSGVLDRPKLYTRKGPVKGGLKLNHFYAIHRKSQNWSIIQT